MRVQTNEIGYKDTNKCDQNKKEKEKQFEYVYVLPPS